MYHLQSDGLWFLSDGSACSLSSDHQRGIVRSSHFPEVVTRRQAASPAHLFFSPLLLLSLRLTSLPAAVSTAEFASLSVNANEPDLASAVAPMLAAATQGSSNSWSCRIVASAWQRRTGAVSQSAVKTKFKVLLTCIVSPRSNLRLSFNPTPRPLHIPSNSRRYISSRNAA
jgi:hypothetical protein